MATKGDEMTPIIMLEAYGCVVWVEENALYDAPMRIDNTVAWDAYGEVTAPENQGFLDAVNRELGTNFMMEQFPGR